MNSEQNLKDNPRNKMYIFNLATDETNPVLAFSIQWLIAFDQEVEKIQVYSTHVRQHSVPNSIKIVEIGGGNFKARLCGFLVLMRALREIGKGRKSALVFHHMSPRTAWIIGPFLKLLHVPQGLWYSHSASTKELRLGAWFVDRVFSTSYETLPIQSKKSIFTGHGIDLKFFPEFTQLKRKSAILSLGRISRIKNNEALIRAVSNSRAKDREVHLIGPVFESEAYLESLFKLGKQLNVEVKYLGEVEHDLVGEVLRQYQICYTGNPNTVDKSVIEGAISGCFTISKQEFVLDQTGMSEVLRVAGENFHPCLEEQIKVLDKLSDVPELRKLIREKASEKNNLNLLVKKIISELQTI